MPPWKRGLAAILFVAGGGGTAAWGIYDAVSWIGSLRGSAAAVETETFILGFPLLGIGLCAIGPEFIAPRWVATWSDTGKMRFVAVVLGAVLAGILLVLLGQFVINVTMELEGYHACEVGARGRVTDVFWNRADVACPSDSSGR